MMLRRVLVACALVLGLAQPAVAGWSEARSRHFIIYSEQKPAELQRFAQDLERFDQVVRRKLLFPDPPLSDNGKLTLYVLRDSNAVAALAGRDSVAGFYIIRPWGVRAFVHREPETSRYRLSARSVFFHEYLHHLMLENSGGVVLPSWYIEGAAEFFSTAKVNKDGSVLLGSPPWHRANGLVRLQGLSIEELVGADTSLSSEEREQLYGRGWLLTHMLYFEPARRGQLERYITDLQKGVAPLDAARSAFGDLKALDRDMQNYLSRRRISGLTVPTVAIAPSSIAVRELGEAHSAILPVIIRSERGVRPQDAQAVLGDARRIAARFPDDPVVLAALAQAEQDAGNNAAAIAAADKALVRDPKSGKALIMKARAMLAEGRRNPAATNWSEVRAVINRANQLDTEHAEPLLMFYQTFLAQGIRPSANAIAALAYAQELLPQSQSIRMLLVRQYMRDQKFAEAARLFAPVAYDPHAGDSQPRRLALLAALKAGAAAQASSLAADLDDDSRPRSGGGR